MWVRGLKLCCKCRYDSRFHAKFIAKIYNDPFVGINCPANIARTFVANIHLLNSIWTKWEAAALFAVEHGHIHFTWANVWPIIDDARLLERALSMYRVTWDVSETQSEIASMTALFSYYDEKDGREVFSNRPKTAKCFTRALIAACLPHLVQKAEVSAFLPTAEAQFADWFFTTASGTGPSLSLVCSLCANHVVGDKSKNQALMYAKTELMGNLNPIKQTLAHMSLAVNQGVEQEEEE